MDMVHVEGVSLFLPNLELIQGTRGCYEYHGKPYRYGFRGSGVVSWDGK